MMLRGRRPWGRGPGTEALVSHGTPYKKIKDGGKIGMVDGIQKERVPERAERTLAVPVHTYSNPFHIWIGLALDLPALAADSCKRYIYTVLLSTAADPFPLPFFI
jgi:hypothetical protein